MTVFGGFWIGKKEILRGLRRGCGGLGTGFFPAVNFFENLVKIPGQDLIDTKYMGSLCH